MPLLQSLELPPFAQWNEVYAIYPTREPRKYA